jgi:hypothetical protein
VSGEHSPAQILDLATVTIETFTPCLGQTFEAVFTDGRIPLKLAEASSLGVARTPEGRPPFSLLFHGATKLRLPQRVYRLENTTLGVMEIFLVQVGDTPNWSGFEAIFN